MWVNPGTGFDWRYYVDVLHVLRQSKTAVGPFRFEHHERLNKMRSPFSLQDFVYLRQSISFAGINEFH